MRGRAFASVRSWLQNARYRNAFVAARENRAGWPKPRYTLLLGGQVAMTSSLLVGAKPGGPGRLLSASVRNTARSFDLQQLAADADGGVCVPSHTRSMVSVID